MGVIIHINIKEGFTLNDKMLSMINCMRIAKIHVTKAIFSFSEKMCYEIIFIISFE